MDNRQEGLQPPHEPQKVALGQWIKPLAGIIESPDTHSEPDFQEKRLRLSLIGVGGLEVALSSTTFDHIPQVRIVRGSLETDTTGKSADEWLKRAEVRGFSLSVQSGDYDSSPIPLRVIVETPMGNIYVNGFIPDEDEPPTVRPQNWKDAEGDNHYLLFPEIEGVWEGVRMKFEKIEDAK